MPSVAQTPPVRVPLQERSRKTLERILDATEALLDEHRFEEVTVQAVVAAAGTSVGAFYSRFRDKDALLPALYERYDRWLRARVLRATEGRAWEGRPLADVAHWVVGELIGLFRPRRNLLRAVALHARSRPEAIDAGTRARRMREMSYLREALLSRRDEIEHPDPERAVDIAVFTAATVCREAILFGDAPHTSAMRLTQAELEREVARQLIGYLRLS